MAEENLQSDELSSEEIREAKMMGWADKDAWRGKPEEWVGAKEFLETGRRILPLVRKSNERLSQEMGQLGGKVSSLESALQAANATIEALQESHEADVQAQVAAARKDLKAQLATAHRDGDHEAAAEITEQMTRLSDAEDDAEAAAAAAEKKRKANGEDRGAPVIDPSIKAWFEANPDFSQNQRKVALGNAVLAELRAKGDKRVGQEILDAVRDEVEEILGGSGGGGTSKVSGGNGGQERRSGGASGGKTYADLPADAKAACDKMAARLVGPDRAHKDIASWRNSYVAQYYKE